MKCENCKNELRQNDALYYVGNHAVVHTSCNQQYINKRMGRNYPCPQCSKTGKMQDVSKTILTHVPLGTNETSECAWGNCRGCNLCINRVKLVKSHPNKTCDLCKGHGYLEKEPKPVMRQVGWEI